MFDPTTVQALGQIRLAEMHAQARRDALARAARRARRQSRRPKGAVGGHPRLAKHAVRGAR